MITQYSGKFGNYILHVCPTFIQIFHDITHDIITLHFTEGDIPEFDLEEFEEDFDRKIVFKTRTYSLQVVHENYYRIALELIDGTTGKIMVSIPHIPMDLSKGLEDIGRNRIPQQGVPIVLSHDSYSDSGYTGSDDDKATFSDTSF